jgi:hypothetical protein
VMHYFGVYIALSARMWCAFGGRLDLPAAYREGFDG